MGVLNIVSNPTLVYQTKQNLENSKIMGVEINFGGWCNILTNKREITSDATGVTAPTTSGGFSQ